MGRAEVISWDIAKEEHANGMWEKETAYSMQATVLKDNVMRISEPSTCMLNARILFILVNMIKLSGY